MDSLMFFYYLFITNKDKDCIFPNYIHGSFITVVHTLVTTAPISTGPQTFQLCALFCPPQFHEVETNDLDTSRFTSITSCRSSRKMQQFPEEQVNSIQEQCPVRETRWVVVDMKTSSEIYLWMLYQFNTVSCHFCYAM